LDYLLRSKFPARQLVTNSVELTQFMLVKRRCGAIRLLGVLAVRGMATFTTTAASPALPRVLSIQSTVAHGYVGNKAATFPLQCLGFHVDAINTVSLSNHPDYAGGFKGQFLSAEDMSNTLQGLQNNKLLEKVDCILTGYTRSTALLEHIEATVKRVTEETNGRSIYICDPVLGDNGSFYVPEELVGFYKTRLIPLAYAITPNYFETEALTGIRVDTLGDARAACDALHALGPKVLLLKGLRLDKDKENGPLTVLLSYRDVDGDKEGSNPGLLMRIDLDRIPGRFSGCGDLFSALCTAGLFRAQKHLAATEEPARVLGALLDGVTSCMSSVVAATQATGGRELFIVESVEKYLALAKDWGSFEGSSSSSSSSSSTSSSRESAGSFVQAGPVSGVIFDMDGTLTLPGAINFDNMYKRNGLTREGGDLIGQIQAMPDEEQRERAFAVLIDEEMLGCERMTLSPKVVELLAALKRNRIRCALSTRNCLAAFHHFEKLAGLPPDAFSPVLTRDCLDGINKPDPRVALHVVEAHWGSTQQQKDRASFWFVGDSEDDVLCGKGAGLKTCLIRTSYNRKFARDRPDVVDLEVDNLQEFASKVLNLVI